MHTYTMYKSTGRQPASDRHVCTYVRISYIHSYVANSCLASIGLHIYYNIIHMIILYIQPQLRPAQIQPADTDTAYNIQSSGETSEMLRLFLPLIYNCNYYLWHCHSQQYISNYNYKQLCRSTTSYYLLPTKAQNKYDYDSSICLHIYDICTYDHMMIMIMSYV